MAVVMPVIGKKISGSRAVAATGMASVAHQIAIHAARETTFHVSAPMPSGASTKVNANATTGPR